MTKNKIQTVSDKDALRYWSSKVEKTLQEIIDDNTKQLQNIKKNLVPAIGLWLRYNMFGFNQNLVGIKPLEEHELIEDRLTEDEYAKLLFISNEVFNGFFYNNQLSNFRYTLRFKDEEDELMYFKSEFKEGNRMNVTYWMLEKDRYDGLEKQFKKELEKNSMYL